jgi:hypothetical protein
MSEEAIKRAYIKGYFAGLEQSVVETNAYRQGIKQGKHEEREYILSFVEDHEGIPINVDDILNEINGRYAAEMKEVLKNSSLINGEPK